MAHISLSFISTSLTREISIEVLLPNDYRYDKLVAWKRESNGSSAMLIEGARRVGKSTIIEEFARNEYDSYILIDFSLVTDEFKRTFLDLRTDLNGFFLYLSAANGVTLIPRKSLVIFDEVQLFPQAREVIKHLVADGRYDYAETGSLISIKQNVKDILIPSEEESLRMYPMDFEEFLWAMGEEPLASLITLSFQRGSGLPDDLHRKASRLWREYMLVGGMPQAVDAYLPGRDMAAADRAKRLVLKLYRDDIEKYGGLATKRIKAVFDAIPGQLSKHQKKLVYTQVERGSRARDFMTAFSWLKEAATVNLCTLSEDPSLGLALSEDETTVKCYLADTGLLSTMAFSNATNTMSDVYRQVLLGDSSVNEGMLAENVVTQQLAAAGDRHPRRAAPTSPSGTARKLVGRRSLASWALSAPALTTSLARVVLLSRILRFRSPACEGTYHLKARAGIF